MSHTYLPGYTFQFFLKNANPGLFLVYFRPFLITISVIQINLLEKSIDGVLGIQTRGRRMIGANENTELWRPPSRFSLYKAKYLQLPTLLIAKNNLPISRSSLPCIFENILSVVRSVGQLDGCSVTRFSNKLGYLWPYI